MRLDPSKPAKLISAGKMSLGLGAGLVFISQTSPDVAKSNLAAWLHVIGIDRIPHALASTSADGYLLVFGIIEIIFALLFWLWARGLQHEIEERNRLRARGVHVEDKRLVGGPLGRLLYWMASRR
jgi:hypothetical protein